MTAEFAVAVNTACLWTSPQAPRPRDAAVLGPQPRLREWLAGQGPQQRLDVWGRIDTQLLLGERVLVDEVVDGWARVVAPQQPSSKDPRGYPGWVPWAQLAEPAEPADAGEGEFVDGSAAPTAARRVVVAVPTTTLHGGPGGDVTMRDVSFATVAPVLAKVPGWVEVALPGRRTGWLAAADVAAWSPTEVGPTVDQLLDAGRMFLGLVYLAGGNCGLALDCSGLIHCVYRRYGVTVPRDAKDQATIGVPVAPEQAEPGDLLLFTNPDTGDLYHVGICAGLPRILQVSQTDWACIDTPLTERRRRHLSGARRLPSR